MIGIGINVPKFGPQTDARALLSWTRFAESNDFTAIVMSIHVAPRGVSGASTPTWPACASPMSPPGPPRPRLAAAQRTAPRPRDYACEKNDLLAVRAALS
jgi:hypothetical protein